MFIGYSDIWVGGGVGQGWVGTILPKASRVYVYLPKVLLRWMPSRLSPLVVAAMSAAAAAAAAADDDDDDDDDDDGGGGGSGGDDDDDDDNDNDDKYDYDDDAFLGLTHLQHQIARQWQNHPCGRQALPTTMSIKKT